METLPELERKLHLERRLVSKGFKKEGSKLKNRIKWEKYQFDSRDLARDLRSYGARLAYTHFKDLCVLIRDPGSRTRSPNPLSDMFWSFSHAIRPSNFPVWFSSNTWLNFWLKCPNYILRTRKQYFLKFGCYKFWSRNFDSGDYFKKSMCYTC